MAGSSKGHPVRSAAHPPAPIVDDDEVTESAEALHGVDPLTLGLVHIGLSPREAQLYHTLLRFGPVTARHAIQTARLDRATGYRVLSRLRVRGLVAATGNRPQQFVALEIARLFERVAAFHRDDLELQRTIREIYQSELYQSRGSPEPTRSAGPPGSAQTPLSLPRPRIGVYRVLPRASDIAKFLVETLAGTKEEFQGLLRPQMIPEPLRTEVQRAIILAVQRGVRVRLAVDYHPAEVEFLTGILRTWDGTPSLLEVRFYAPQFARLYLADRRIAMRCIDLPGSPSMGPEFGVASEDGEYYRYQSSRFQTVWRDALPMEQANPTAGGIRFVPTSSARELRHWVEHTHRSDYARTMTTAPWEYSPPRHPVLR